MPAEDPAWNRPRDRAAAGDRGGGRCLAIVVARDEEAAVGAVLGGLPRAGVRHAGRRRSWSTTARATPRRDDRPCGRRAGRLAPGARRGLGAALRTGLELARDEGYDAAVYLDGDGEYDPADLARVLEPVARGRADYVLGSRFLGRRDGMTWHRTLANRLTSAAARHC